jgi:hypothetical protein
MLLNVPFQGSKELFDSLLFVIWELVTLNIYKNYAIVAYYTAQNFPSYSQVNFASFTWLTVKMKLDILLVFVSFMGIVKGTTNEEWVGDLEKVTKWLTQIPSSPQGNSRVVWYRFYEYSLKLSNAANRQRIAARPAPPSGKGAEMVHSAST